VLKFVMWGEKSGCREKGKRATCKQPWGGTNPPTLNLVRGRNCSAVRKWAAFDVIRGRKEGEKEEAKSFRHSWGKKKKRPRLRLRTLSRKGKGNSFLKKKGPAESVLCRKRKKRGGPSFLG